jgi:hypothetical protein
MPAHAKARFCVPNLAETPPVHAFQLALCLLRVAALGYLVGLVADNVYAQSTKHHRH